MKWHPGSTIWSGFCLVAVILVPVLSGQFEMAAETASTSSEATTDVVPARRGVRADGVSPLRRMASETLDGIGQFPPSNWRVTALTVTDVVPLDNAVDVPVSTNVTVTFSREVDPVSVTTESFLLLDPDSDPVPAQVSVGPLALQATLNPDEGLALDTVYTVSLTPDIHGPTGLGLLPFTSHFVTTATPPQEELPESSEETEPPAGVTETKIGSAVSSAGDLNGDGIGDFITGAPGLTVGDQVEAGALLVYFGSAVTQELVKPDIIFEGVSAHDRTGVSAAGDFDFNGDTIPDIAIGAEQVNRTDTDDPTAGCDAGAPCDSGRVYLIYFDPFDTTHYPNINDPDLTDVVDLSEVGGSLPGVVFTGDFGDQVGFAVAGGGRFDLGLGQDLAIGAPGTDPGEPPRTDAGEVYVIFDDASLTGSIRVDRVGNGEPDEIAGVAYLGAAAGDHLGFSVVFPGDVMGAIGDDLAMGAPHADTTNGALLYPGEVFEDAGIVYVPEGGNPLRDERGIIESSNVGVGETGSQTGGDQTGMNLGWSLAGGGDNLVDGEADLLMGAPGYDGVDELGQPVPDTGLVVQTASKLEHGIITASQIGADPATDPDAVNGVQYVGDSEDDQLGTTVAGLGDVTGDGFDDVAFGAPYDDPVVDDQPVFDAGTVYVVEGYVTADLNLGQIESTDIGDTVAGTQLVGTQEEEHAGQSLASTDDLNFDGDPDFLVGAPDRDAEVSDDDVGTVYIVLESEPESPGTCGPEGCVIADLLTGARAAVPQGSLFEAIDLAVSGVWALWMLPVPPPPGMSLLGAADFDPEGQTFDPPLPTIHLPVWPGLEGQSTLR